MTATLRFALVLILVGLFAFAGIVSLTGEWTITMIGVFPDQTTCQYSGVAQITENDGRVSGHVEQNRISGSADICPATMNAQLDGTIDGSSINGTLDGGQPFGLATFEGTVGGDNLTGTFQTGLFDEEASVSARGQMEPFPGVTGTWRADSSSALGVPVLSGLGLTLLAAGLVAASFFILRASA